jgi:hypothetical protein
MLAQQTIPASRDARKAPPMAPDADIPFVPWAHLAVLNALYRRRRALEAMLAGRPVTIATTSPTRGGDDVTDRYVVDLKIDAAAGVICVTRLALDDVMLADLECQPDNAAIAVIVEHFVIPVELNPAGIVVTARLYAVVVLPGSGAWAIRQSSPARPACTIRTWTTCRCGSSSNSAASSFRSVSSSAWRQVRWCRWPARSTSRSTSWLTAGG